jgi:hypothetical protein
MPGDALRLAEGFRAHAFKLLPHFRGQARDLRVVEPCRDRGGFVAPRARDFLALAVEVAGVPGFDLDLLGDLGVVDAGAELRHPHQRRVVEFRAAQQVDGIGLA